jgi:hypothetical protein
MEAGQEVEEMLKRFPRRTSRGVFEVIDVVGNRGYAE